MKPPQPEQPLFLTWLGRFPNSSWIQDPCVREGHQHSPHQGSLPPELQPDPAVSLEGPHAGTCISTCWGHGTALSPVPMAWATPVLWPSVCCSAMALGTKTTLCPLHQYIPFPFRHPASTLLPLLSLHPSPGEARCQGPAPLTGTKPTNSKATDSKATDSKATYDREPR